MDSERPKSTVLIIDDDRLFCQMACEYLSGDKIQVISAHTGQDGLALCGRHHVDIVLLDQKLPDGEGYDLCPRIIQLSENAKIIFVTAFPSFKNALKAIESGAFSYLTKPFDLKELKISVEKCLRVSELEKVEQSLHYQSDRKEFAGDLVGAGDSLAAVAALISSAARTRSPVLITGETGSGKSLVARLIHRASGRRGPFMSINCSALPENLIESELFGHEKGAFSGALATKKGLLEIAEGGSVLLDEIGEMGFHLQAKLLGVLDEMQLRRIGGVVSHPVQVRLMAATNAPLEARIEERRFREDLYYRLNVVRLHLPPLRERRSDIPRLAELFLKELAPQRELVIRPQDLEMLRGYHWPGNIRELRNVIEMAVIHTQEGIQLQIPRLINAPLQASKGPPDLGTGEGIMTLQEMERNYAAEVYARLDCNLTKTAKALGISLNTLKKKLAAPRG